MTEDQIQRECVFWFRQKYSRKDSNPFAVIFAVPNGGRRDGLTGAVMQATGVLAGVTDLIMLHNSKVYFIELKTATGTLSKSQQRFKLMLEMCGLGDNWYMIRGVDEFKELINKLITK